MRKHKLKTNKIVLIFLFSLFYTTNIFALDLKDFQKKINNKPIQIPGIQNYQGTLIYHKSLETYPFSMTIKSNKKKNIIDYTYSSKEWEGNYQVNQQFTLLNSRVIAKTQKQIDSSKFDLRKVRLGKEKERIFTFFLNKEIKKEKGVKYTENTVDATTLTLFLQNALYHNITDFYCDFVVEQLPMSSGIKVSRFETSNLIEIGPQYTKPKQIKEISKLKEKVIYFETAVQGIGSFFYPHKHYYIYQSKPPYRFIGAWGGPKETMFYQYIPKNLPK